MSYVHPLASEGPERRARGWGVVTGEEQHRATPPASRPAPSSAPSFRPRPGSPTSHPARPGPAPNARAVPWTPRRTKGSPGQLHHQHRTGRRVTMMTAGMLSGKEVTEKADGIVPATAALAFDYRYVCLWRRLSRCLGCRETCGAGSGR